jgi:predicted MFS family arabinose efflux permease
VPATLGRLTRLRNRGIYFAVIGGVWAIASAVGPVLGGVFTDLATWRWAFWINMPCDGIAFVILLIFLDIETPRTPIIAGLKAIDYLGSLAIVGGTIMFLYGLELGGVSRPWSSIEVICLLVFGLATIALFFLIEGKAARYPLIPLRLFARRSNLASLAVCFVHSFVFIAGAYFLPLYFQAVLGVSPLLSGVYLFPFVLTLSLGSAGTGIFIRKTGQYLLPIRLGLFLMTLGAGLFADLPPTASWPRLILFQLIAGLGAGPNFQAPLIALQSLVPPADIASATATFGFVRQLSSALSIVIGGVIFQNGMHVRTPDLLAAGIAPAVAAQLGAGSAGANTAVVAALPGPQHAAATSAYTLSLQLMWVFYLCVAVFGGLASAAIGRNVLSKTHHVTKTGLAVQEADRRERLAETRRKKTAAKEEAEGEGGGKEPV